jgi:hypothetical protein
MVWVDEIKWGLVHWDGKDIELLFSDPERLSAEKLLEVYDNIVDIALERLDYWCWEISADSVEDCYGKHRDIGVDGVLDIYLIEPDFSEFEQRLFRIIKHKLGVERFAEWLSEKDEEVRSRIERVLRELGEEHEVNE